MSDKTSKVQYWGDRLSGGTDLNVEPLHLSIDDITIVVRTNSETLRSKLAYYFSPVLSDQSSADIEVLAVEREALDLDIEFVDWKREADKTGRKDSYHDIEGGRVLRKVRTGMVFLQSENIRIAAGPCLENDNQVINFINAQVANVLQHRGGLTCHAAAVASDGNVYAMAGFSGGGKSTLMLHMLENDQLKYLTNDRLYSYVKQDQVIGAGIPKLPRVNPGTIVYNQRLHGLIHEQRRSELLNLPVSQLWDLEEKYDVIIDEVYGPNRVANPGPLKAFLILNWQRDSDAPVQLTQVDLNERRDLLAAIMKSPGPFYQRADGTMHQDSVALDEQAYLDQLNDVAIYEASGGVDFSSLAKLYLEIMKG